MSFRTVTIAAVLLCAAVAAATQSAPDTLPADDGDITIVPISHATLQIVHGHTVVLVDPALDGALPPIRVPPDAPPRPPAPAPPPGTVRTTRYVGLSKPTLILVTHRHEDHFAAEAVAFVETPTTRIVVPASMESEVPDAIGLANGETATIDGVTVEAIPMYNIRRGLESGGPFHVRGEGNGYVVTIGGKRLYVAGDTECVPEIRALDDIDVAFLPMNLPFTMTPAEAAACAETFRPAIAYPYHYAGQDFREFGAALAGSGIKVRLRNWYPVIRARR